jgi:hypothetical protein
MLEKFLKPILEAKNPDYMLLQKDRAPRCIQKELTDFFYRRLSEIWVNVGGPIT